MEEEQEERIQAPACRWCDVSVRTDILEGLRLEQTPFGWFLSLDGEDLKTSSAAVRFCPWCGRYLDPTLMPAPDDSSTLRMEQEETETVEETDSYEKID